MKKLSITSIVLTIGLFLPSFDAFALDAPMSGVDMQGFYNSSGYALMQT